MDENKTQRDAIYRIMQSGAWFTLYELRSRLPMMASDAGISARVRDFRKARYGGYTVLRRKKEGCERTYEYSLLPPRSQVIAGVQQPLPLFTD